MRSLGIDYGRKRIGLALSDPNLLMAFPYDTIVNKGITKTVVRINEIIKQNDVDVVVIGLPLHASGGESEMSREVRAFGTAVATLGVTVEYIDERYTSCTAEEMIRESFPHSRRGDSKKIREKVANSVDKVADSVILKMYLNERGK